MPRRFLKSLVSTAFAIAAFSQYSKVFADVLQAGTPAETFGYFVVDKNGKYVYSYARVIGSKTGFGVAITAPSQIIADNGLVVPTALFIDCKNMRANFNFTQELPAENFKEWTMEAVSYQATFFCDTHKYYFEHLHW